MYIFKTPFHIDLGKFSEKYQNLHCYEAQNNCQIYICIKCNDNKI